MAVSIPALERFTTLKKKRDALSNQLATLQGKLDSSRDRYNDIMRELAVYKIGSVDELQQHISNLNQQIERGLDEAEALLAKMEQELKTVEQAA
jgi:uncharacterized coiled-coil DUF342 family protein